MQFLWPDQNTDTIKGTVKKWPHKDNFTGCAYKDSLLLPWPWLSVRVKVVSGSVTPEVNRSFLLRKINHNNSNICSKEITIMLLYVTVKLFYFQDIKEPQKHSAQWKQSDPFFALHYSGKEKDAFLLLGACLEESWHSYAEPAYQGSSSKKHNLVHNINSSGKASAIILNLKLNLDPSGN